MGEKEAMEFDVPENVRSRSNFLGLDLLGWALFAPVLFLIGLLFYVVIPLFTDSLLWRIGICGFLVIIAYLSFRLDEKTGEMEIEFVLDFLNWIRAEKQISPKWGDENEVGLVLSDEETTER